MLDKMTNRLDFLGSALTLRAERQRAIASNIANADTPGYVARDFKFSDALRNILTSLSGVKRRRFPIHTYPPGSWRKLKDWKKWREKKTRSGRPLHLQPAWPQSPFWEFLSGAVM